MATKKPVKKVHVKKSAARGSYASSKLAINGTFDDVIKVAMTPKKKA